MMPSLSVWQVIINGPDAQEIMQIFIFLPVYSALESRIVQEMLANISRHSGSRKRIVNTVKYSMLRQQI
jgi:hypothetical protein